MADYRILGSAPHLCAVNLAEQAISCWAEAALRQRALPASLALDKASQDRSE